MIKKINKLIQFKQWILHWTKLDKIKYFDESKTYLFGFEIAGGLSMIIVGIVLCLLILLIVPIWYYCLIPFGICIILPLIIWGVGFICAWIKVL